MDIHPVNLSGSVEFEFREEWSQLWTSCNWYTFTPIHLEVENDKMMGNLEIVVMVLGLGFRFSWNHTRTEFAEEIERRVADLDGRDL